MLAASAQYRPCTGTYRHVIQAYSVRLGFHADSINKNLNDDYIAVLKSTSLTLGHAPPGKITIHLSIEPGRNFSKDSGDGLKDPWGYNFHPNCL